MPFCVVCIKKKPPGLHPAIMFYQIIAEILYNSAVFSFFRTGQDDLAAAFLVSDRKQLYWKMSGRIAKITGKRPPGAGGPETDAHSRCDQVAHRFCGVTFKNDMGGKSCFHKIAVCDLADRFGTTQTDIIGIFRVC